MLPIVFSLPRCVIGIGSPIEKIIVSNNAE